jgi:hypothetical protein
MVIVARTPVCDVRRWKEEQAVERVRLTQLSSKAG